MHSLETRSKLSIAARARRKKTHCKRGHLLSLDNSFKTKSGYRQCKKCQKIRAALVLQDPVKHEARKALSRRWASDHVDVMAEHAWRRHGIVGMTWDRFLTMMEAQHGLCAWCGLPPHGGRRLTVDHDKTTGRVRGLLHDVCNRGIVRDHTLESALHLVEYLRAAADA